jgi:hypothetical protein
MLGDEDRMTIRRLLRPQVNVTWNGWLVMRVRRSSISDSSGMAHYPYVAETADAGGVEMPWPTSR